MHTLLQEKLRREIYLFLNNQKEQVVQYSLRGLAKKIEMQPSHLSEFLKGKKNLSPQKCHSVIEKLPFEDSFKKDIQKEFSGSMMVKIVVPENKRELFLNFLEEHHLMKLEEESMIPFQSYLEIQ